MHKCFQKVTVKNQRESRKEEKLYEKWKNLKNKDDPESKAQMEEVEEKLAEEYFNKVKLASKDVDCAEGGNILSEIWKLKKRIVSSQQRSPHSYDGREGKPSHKC